MQRTVEILTSLGSFGLNLFLDQRKGVLDKNRRVRAIELKTIFTQLGPTFVKLGQGLSTRPDICPPEFLEELSELQVCVLFPLAHFFWFTAVALIIFEHLPCVPYSLECSFCCIHFY